MRYYVAAYAKYTRLDRSPNYTPAESCQRGKKSYYDAAQASIESKNIWPSVLMRSLTGRSYQ